MLNKKQVVIGCDNSAVSLKNEIIAVLQELQIPYKDVGVNESNDKTYYPLIAAHVCKEIIASDYSKEGILICGTGIGMAMTANKFHGIFAAVCHDNYSAERSRLSNNGNILCMGARIIGPELAKKILREWLSLKYVPNERSQPKVEAMREIDSFQRKKLQSG